MRLRRSVCARRLVNVFAGLVQKQLSLPAVARSLARALACPRPSQMRTKVVALLLGRHVVGDGEGGRRAPLWTGHFEDLHFQTSRQRAKRKKAPRPVVPPPSKAQSVCGRRTPRKTTAAGGRMGELSDRDDYEVAGGLLPALPAYPARVFPLPARGRHAAGGGARRVVRCAASRRRQAEPAAPSAALKSPGRWRCAATLPGGSTDTLLASRAWSPGAVW